MAYGKGQGLGSQAELGFPARVAMSTDLPSLSLGFSIHEMGPVGLLYTKLQPEMDPDQGLEGQVSKTDSSQPLGFSQNGGMGQNTGS